MLLYIILIIKYRLAKRSVMINIKPEIPYKLSKEQVGFFFFYV